MGSRKLSQRSLNLGAAAAISELHGGLRRTAPQRITLLYVVAQRRIKQCHDTALCEICYCIHRLLVMAETTLSPYSCKGLLWVLANHWPLNLSWGVVAATSTASLYPLKLQAQEKWVQKQSLLLPYRMPRKLFYLHCYYTLKIVFCFETLQCFQIICICTVLWVLRFLCV